MVFKLQESGFCYGVRNAMERAKQCGHKMESKQVVLLGSLVNNDSIIQGFKKRGFIVEENVHAIPKGATVVIRAHGVSKIVYEELKKKGVAIGDCTCSKIQKIHEIVAQKSAEGYRIVVVGKKKHPEVIGTVGWSNGSPALIVENESDLKDIDISGKVCIVAQTTCNREEWERIVDQMLRINPTCEVKDTLCSVTKIREYNARELAKKVDAMIVLGDKSSSNSKELYRRCCLECQNTFFISSLTELQSDKAALDKVLHSTDIGLTGGTSVSDEVIAEVYNYLVFLDFQKNAKLEIDEFFSAYNKEHSEKIKENPFILDSWADLNEQNRGGKRIRGTLLSWVK